MTRSPDFGVEPHNRARGRAAEEAAVGWLAERGYRILERNVRNRAGEIDVVARRGEILCFVEIKARSSGRFGQAIAAVGRRKQARIARAAALYLAANPYDGPCRFDVLGLDPEAGDWRFELVENAFEAGP